MADTTKHWSPKKTKWRYQPVVMEGQGEEYVCLVAVYTPDGHPEGPLESWAVSPEEPYGEDRAALLRVLNRMFVAALGWHEVKFSDLKVGMMFEKSNPPIDAANGGHGAN